MKILLISHYFPPEIGAPSARLFEMAKHWVNEGNEVKVLTCFPNHPTGIIPEEYSGMNVMLEEIEGIKVYRTYTYATPNEGFIKKTLGHISFMFSSFVQGRKRIGEFDVIVVSSPTFFSVFSAYAYSLTRRKPWVLEVRDLWPAALVELDILKNKTVIKILERLELFFYKRAKKVVLVTDSFKENLIHRGIDERKLEVVKNGVNPNNFKNNPNLKNAMKKKWNLENKFIVLYIGAHGISQALDKVIDAAKELKGIDDIQFVFVGEGAKKKELIEKTKKENVSNVMFIGGQKKSEVESFYNMADVGIVSLRDIQLFQTFIPSKMFEILSTETPLIAAVAGESKDILESSGGAIVVPPENPIKLKEQIIYLRDNRNVGEEMGRKGREFVTQYYSRKNLARKYLEILKNVLLKKEKI